MRDALSEPCRQHILANTDLCLLAPLYLHEEKCWLVVDWVRRVNALAAASNVDRSVEGRPVVFVGKGAGVP
jgi:hypothetical protein